MSSKMGGWVMENEKDWTRYWTGHSRQKSEAGIVARVFTVYGGWGGWADQIRVRLAMRSAWRGEQGMS